jgi:hypothetical protein
MNRTEQVLRPLFQGSYIDSNNVTHGFLRLPF